MFADDPQIIIVNSQLEAEAVVNPDYYGRPSPVHIRIYELRGVEAFAEAEYNALFEQEEDILGDDLIKHEDYRLTPGELQEFDFQADPEIKFLGVVAAFRNIEDANWRASLDLVVDEDDDEQEIPITISLEELSVALDFQPEKHWWHRLPFLGPDEAEAEEKATEKKSAEPSGDDGSASDEGSDEVKEGEEGNEINSTLKSIAKAILIQGMVGIVIGALL